MSQPVSLTYRLISLIILAALLISCGENSSPSAGETSNDAGVKSTSAETLSFADAHAAVKDDLPEADFEGESFVITINDYVVGEYIDTTDIMGLKHKPTNGCRCSPVFLCAMKYCKPDLTAALLSVDTIPVIYKE